MSDGDDGDRRPKRRCARRATANETLYVGYVEDNETPEMIMKKFEALDKVMAPADAPAPDADAPDAAAAAPPSLTEAQLRAVFKATSTFTVDAALDGGLDTPDWMSSADEDEGPDDSMLADFWNEEGGGDDEEEGGAAPAPRPRSHKRGAGSTRGAPRAPKPPPGGAAARAALPRTHMVTAGGGAQALIRRRVRAVDKDALVTLRVPRPLPLSWGRSLTQWAPRPAPPAVAAAADAADALPPAPGAGAAYECDVLAALAARKGAALSRTFQCVLINAGWDGHGVGAARAAGPLAPHGGPAALAALASIPLPALVPSGYAFAWATKEALAPLTAAMAGWGFHYVENLTWVVLGAHHGALAAPSPLAARSHLTLMIYRRAGEDVDLRHQRSPDVVFDTVRRCRAAPGYETPPAAWAAIETMLPGATKGAALELWGSERAGARPGWTTLVQKQA